MPSPYIALYSPGCNFKQTISESAITSVGLAEKSRTPATLYPRQHVPKIRDSRLVPSLGGCLPSRTRGRSDPETRTLFQYNIYY